LDGRKYICMIFTFQNIETEFQIRGKPHNIYKYNMNGNNEIMSKKKRTKKTINNNTEIWTEEQYEKYMKGLYSLELIAGYTEGGVPYGITFDEDINEVNLSDLNRSIINGEELPFD
jgi:hypothetical protein